MVTSNEQVDPAFAMLEQTTWMTALLAVPMWSEAAAATPDRATPWQVDGTPHIDVGSAGDGGPTATGHWVRDHGVLAWATVLDHARAAGALPFDVGVAALPTIVTPAFVAGPSALTGLRTQIHRVLGAVPSAHPATALYAVPLALWLDRDPRAALRLLDRAVECLDPGAAAGFGLTIVLTYAIARAVTEGPDAAVSFLHASGQGSTSWAAADANEMTYHVARYHAAAGRSQEAATGIAQLATRDAAYATRWTADPVVIAAPRGVPTESATPFAIHRPSAPASDVERRLTQCAEALPKDFPLRLGPGYAPHFGGPVDSDLTALTHMIDADRRRDAAVALVRDVPTAIRLALLEATERLAGAIAASGDAAVARSDAPNARTAVAGAAACTGLIEAIDHLPREVSEDLAPAAARIWAALREIERTWMASGDADARATTLELPRATVAVPRGRWAPCAVGVTDRHGRPVPGAILEWDVETGPAIPHDGTTCLADHWGVAMDRGIAYLTLAAPAQIPGDDVVIGALRVRLRGDREFLTMPYRVLPAPSPSR